MYLTSMASLFYLVSIFDLDNNITNMPSVFKETKSSHCVDCGHCVAEIRYSLCGLYCCTFEGEYTNINHRYNFSIRASPIRLPFLLSIFT